MQEKAATKYNTSVQAKIALPRTEGRINIVIESDTNRNLKDRAFSDDPLTAVTDSTYSGGLRYVIQHSDKWYSHVDTGIQFAVPIDLFVCGQLRRNYQWSK